MLHGSLNSHILKIISKDSLIEEERIGVRGGRRHKYYQAVGLQTPHLLSHQPVQLSNLPIKHPRRIWTKNSAIKNIYQKLLSSKISKTFTFCNSMLAGVKSCFSIVMNFSLKHLYSFSHLSIAIGDTYLISDLSHRIHYYKS